MIKIVQGLIIGYIILNTIIIILLKLTLVTYGNQLIDSFFFLILLLALPVSLLLKWCIDKSKNVAQKIWMVVAVIFVLVMIYFVIEDCRFIK